MIRTLSVMAIVFMFDGSLCAADQVEVDATGMRVNDELKVTDSTESTGPTDGALSVVGGAGIGGALNVGGVASFDQYIFGKNISMTLSTASGENSKYTATFRRNTVADQNTTSYDKAVCGYILNWDIANGVVDSGYKVGAHGAAYSMDTAFEGTLTQSIGVWARSGLLNAGPQARLDKAFGLKADILSNAGTIGNAYGVHINSGGGSGTVENRYDLYAANSAAKNYFAGSVGIGNASPNAKLDVNGNARISNDLNVEGQFITNSANITGTSGILTLQDSDSAGQQADAWVQFKDKDNVTLGIIGTSQYTEDYVVYQSDPPNSSGHKFYTRGPSSWLERFRVDGSDGNVYVSNDVKVGGKIILDDSTSYVRTDTTDGADNKRLLVCGSSSAANARGGYISLMGNEYPGQEGGIGLSAGNSSAHGHIDFYTQNANIRMRVEREGNVRIWEELKVGGSNLVQTKVDPNGNPNIELRGTGGAQPYIDFTGNGGLDYELRLIASNSGELELKGGNLHISGGDLVTDQATYPDYVFEDDYKLMPIDKVDDFIKKHKHLPKVKSAREIIKNGMSVGDQVVMQMEKIEELTLYTIQQHKQIKQQQKEINELRMLVEKLIQKNELSEN